MLLTTWTYFILFKTLKNIMKWNFRRNLSLSSSFIKIRRKEEWNSLLPKEKILQVENSHERSKKETKLLLWSQEEVYQKLHWRDNKLNLLNLILFRLKELKLNQNQKKFKKKILRNSLRIEFWNLFLSLPILLILKNLHYRSNEKSSMIILM